MSPAHDCVSMVTLSRILTGEKAAVDVYTVYTWRENRTKRKVENKYKKKKES